MPGKRIAIFGGTFDPPHLGHLLLAETALDQLDASLVIWVPAYASPEKTDSTNLSPHHRVQMATLATHGRPRFHVSTIEVDRAGVSYTVDTLESLKEQYAGDALYLLMGGDSLRAFSGWRDPERIKSLAKIAVFRRQGNSKWPTSVEEHDATILNAPAVEISSSDIRHRVKTGRSIRYLVPDPVRSYILKNRLYR